MTYPKYGIATERVRLAKSVLALSALGIFAKLLKVDLSHLQVLGLSFDPATGQLIPGFIGVALVYALLALLVSTGEGAMENATDKHVIESNEEWAKSRTKVAFSLIALPFSLVVYLMPYFMGAFAIYLLYGDIVSVLSAIWQLAKGV